MAATAQPPVRRTLKVRVARIYTPSQKGEILEHAATHGISEASKKFGVSRYDLRVAAEGLQRGGGQRHVADVGAGAWGA